MLLVLSTQHVFQPLAIEGQEVNLWETTWTKLGPVLPKLKLELFPNSPRASVSLLTSQEIALQKQETTETLNEKNEAVDVK